MKQRNKLFAPGLIATLTAGAVMGAVSVQSNADTLCSQPKVVCAGQTTPGDTNWQVYTSTGVYVDVDTSACNLASTPIYTMSLGGYSTHWETTGGSSVYSADEDSFRIYVRYLDGRAFTPDTANGYEWHINWTAIDPTACGGSMAYPGLAASIRDLNQNTYPEVALLASNEGSGIVVDIMDSGTAQLVNSIEFLDADWQATAINTLAVASPDPLIAVTAVNRGTGKTAVEIRYAQTGNLFDSPLSNLED